MRVFTIANQPSIPKAYTQYTSEGGNDVGRSTSSDNRDRLVNCMGKFVQFTIEMKPHLALFGDRFSERQERRQRELDAKRRQGVFDGKQDSSEGLKERKKVDGVRSRQESDRNCNCPLAAGLRIDPEALSDFAIK